MPSSRHEIVAFLSEFKELMTCRQFDMLGDRRNNIDTMVMLGFTKEQRRECLFSLSAADYCEGPEPDISGSGVVWIFGTEIDEMLIYIRLKIDDMETGRRAKCLSFHKAEYRMNFPYKE